MKLPLTETLPRIILLLSPCRSGSSALGRVFASAGYPCYFQPLKAILRHLHLGRPASWEVPCIAGPLVIKETYGPYLRDECYLDPLEILLEAGYPQEEIHVVALLRAPGPTLSSWREWWPTVPVDNFVRAYRHAGGRRAAAMVCGMNVTTYVYEVLQHYPSEVVMRNLFEALEIDYSEAAVDWRHAASSEAASSQVVLSDDPPRFMAEGILEGLWKAPAYAFVPRDTRNLTAADLSLIGRSGLQQLYADFKIACEKDLGIRLEALVGN